MCGACGVRCAFAVVIVRVLGGVRVCVCCARVLPYVCVCTEGCAGLDGGSAAPQGE